MIAREAIVSDMPSIEFTDSLHQASLLMDEFKVSELPIVNENGKYLGVLTEELLFDESDWEQEIKACATKLNQFHVTESIHLLEVFKKMNEWKRSTLAVIDEKGFYLGSTSSEKLVSITGALPMSNDKGGLLELEMSILDYSLAQIAQIVESDNGRITGMYLTGAPDSKKVRVTIKINRSNLSHIISSFERYQYTIVASYHQEDSPDQLKSNFDNLMNFMNI